MGSLLRGKLAPIDPFKSLAEPPKATPRPPSPPPPPPPPPRRSRGLNSKESESSLLSGSLPAVRQHASIYPAPNKSDRVGWDIHKVMTDNHFNYLKTTALAIKKGRTPDSRSQARSTRRRLRLAGLASLAINGRADVLAPPAQPGALTLQPGAHYDDIALLPPSAPPFGHTVKTEKYVALTSGAEDGTRSKRLSRTAKRPDTTPDPAPLPLSRAG